MRTLLHFQSIDSFASHTHTHTLPLLPFSVTMGSDKTSKSIKKEKKDKPTDSAAATASSSSKDAAAQSTALVAADFHLKSEAVTAPINTAEWPLLLKASHIAPVEKRNNDNKRLRCTIDSNQQIKKCRLQFQNNNTNRSIVYRLCHAAALRRRSNIWCRRQTSAAAASPIRMH